MNRCCPRECEYRPERVAHYLGVIIDMEQAGEDPSLAATQGGSSLDRIGGGSVGDGGAGIWDVRGAMLALRREGIAPTAVAISKRLCPWSLDDL